MNPKERSSTTPEGRSIVEAETPVGEKDSPGPASQQPSKLEVAEMKLRRDLQMEQDDLVVFGEDGQFHLVQKATYMANELPDSLMSTAEFLVGLGAVVADATAFEWEVLWKKLMTNCSCIVLNLAAIRQISEKKDKPITLPHKPDGKRHRFGRRSDHLTSKEAGSAALAAARKRAPNPELKLGPDDLVLFNEDKKFYWVKKEDYVSQSSELPPTMRSAPELMVMLGTVVADIPRIPTAGTACYLLNLASVRHGSRYAAQLLAENIQASRQPERKGKRLVEELKEKRNAADAALQAKKQEDMSRLEEWAKSAKEHEESKQKLPADVFQKMVAQQLQIIESKQKHLHALDKVLQTELAPPAEPVTGAREFRAASARSKRAPGKRASTTRGTPRGRKK